MLPDPDPILECPSCGASVTQPTISFFNTFGAIYHTDGWMAAPMLPQAALHGDCAAVLTVEFGLELALPLEAWHAVPVFTL